MQQPAISRPSLERAPHGPRSLFQPRTQPKRQSVLRPSAPPVTPAGAAPIPPEGTSFSSLSFGDQNSLANRGIYEPGSFGDQNARANASSGEGMAGSAANPSPQIPGLSTGLKPVPPQPRTAPLPAGGPSPTGAPLGAPTADSPQAWRGAVQPGATPKAPPGGSLDEATPRVGNPLPKGPVAGADENPNAVPGVFKSTPAKQDPLGAGATPSKLTMVQTTPPSPPQQEAHNPMAGAPAGPMEGQSAPVNTAPVNPGASMGMSSRGNAPMPGQPLPSPTNPDEEHVGGEGPYAKKFSNPRSAALYGSYIKNLFSSPSPRPAPQPALSAPAGGNDQGI